MAILAECPRCHKKQKVSNKACACGENLDRAKRSKRVKYWIAYRLPDGLQRREIVNGENLDPHSIEDARAFEAKRKVQKKEKRVFDMLPESTMTFKDLSEWYLSLEKVKALVSFKTVRQYVNKFCLDFGDTIVRDLKLTDIENIQVRRIKAGTKPKTVDNEMEYTKSMVIKAFDENMVSGDVLRVFKRRKRVLKPNSNRRTRVLTFREFNDLHSKAPKHLADILTLAYWTGMRRGEIMKLIWNCVDLENRIIRLGSADTKEGQPKTIPIGEEVFKVLSQKGNRLRDANEENHVFLYNGSPIKDNFYKAIQTGCRNAKILWGRKEKGGFIFHDLRHTFITDMRRAGVARTVTMAITGHAINDMNARYDTVEEWEKLEAIRTLMKFRNVDQNVDQEKIVL
jgi:integrase